jgi:uncharacterized protein YjdB
VTRCVARNRRLCVVLALLTGCGGADADGIRATTLTIDSISITVTPPTASLRIGESVRLTALVAGAPPSASHDVTFTSFNDSIAVVVPIGNSMGKVTAHANGGVRVTATSVANPQKTATSMIDIAP